MAIFSKRRQREADKAAKEMEAAVEQMDAAIHEAHAAVAVVRGDVQARVFLAEHIASEGPPSDVESLERYATKANEVGLPFPETVLSSLRARPAVIPAMGMGFVEEQQRELEEGTQFLDDVSPEFRGDGPELIESDRALVESARESLRHLAGLTSGR